MPSKMSLMCRAAISNAVHSRVSRAGVVHAQALFRHLRPTSALIMGGDADRRALAAANALESMLDGCPMPALVLTRSGSPLASRLLQGAAPATKIDGGCRYSYLNGLGIEPVHSLLTGLAAAQACGEPGDLSAWCRAFLCAVDARNAVSLASMALLAAQDDPQIADFAEYAGLPMQMVSVLRAYPGQAVRSLIQDMANKLPFAGAGEEEELCLLGLAAACSETQATHVLLLDCFDRGTQALTNACLAAELGELMKYQTPFALVLDGVLMADEQDPLLGLLPGLWNHPLARVVLSAASPAAVPGRLEALQGFGLQVVYPFGDIGDTLQTVLDGYGRYWHAEVNTSVNRRPFSMPFSRRDNYAIVHVERPVVEKADCSGCEAIISSGGCGHPEFLLASRFICR